jgi:hypothetical protein
MTFSISTVLEVGLGLALVFYILSLIVSSITTKIAEWTELGAKDLEIGLRDLLADSDKLDEFMNHPWIQNLKPKRLKLLRGGIETKRVNFIPPSTFALTVFDVLVPGDKGPEPVDQIRAAIDALPGESTKRTLQGMLHSGVKSIDDARKFVEGWFDDSMNNVSLLYKQHARRIAIIVALVVTLVTGADSVAIGNSLWQEPSVRAAIAAKIDRSVQVEPEGDVDALISELEELSIPILWNPDSLPQDTTAWALKAFGLTITWVAISQGSSFWYQVLKRFRGE